MYFKEQLTVLVQCQRVKQKIALSNQVGIAGRKPSQNGIKQKIDYLGNKFIMLHLLSTYQLLWIYVECHLIFLFSIQSASAEEENYQGDLDDEGVCSRLDKWMSLDSLFNL